MRMEHIYKFQHWLFFIGLGVLLSLSLCKFLSRISLFFSLFFFFLYYTPIPYLNIVNVAAVKANDFEGSNDRRSIALKARSFVSINENRTALSRKLLLSPGNS